VIKIGTGSLMRKGGGLNVRRIRSLARDIRRIKHKTRNVVVVTSGAIVAGMDELGIRDSPQDLSIRLKQTCAAVGQPLLMNTYFREFGRVGLKTAQILVTQEDFGDATKHRNLWRTLRSLFDFGLVPVMNENDPVAVHELKRVASSVPSQLRFGDNDRLSAIVAVEIRADLLVMLTDVDGLYERGHGASAARLIRTCRGVTDELLALAGGAGPMGSGGMKSKLEAAKLASSAGIVVVISNGHRTGGVSKAVTGKPEGTAILPMVSAR